MKKKAIEEIPYFGLKELSKKKNVKYIGITEVKVVGNEKHLFLEVYRREYSARRRRFKKNKRVLQGNCVE